MKTRIDIEIKNLTVKASGYYSFDWVATVNGKKKKGSYDASYSGQSAAAFRGILKRGYAIQLAIGELFG